MESVRFPTAQWVGNGYQVLSVAERWMAATATRFTVVPRQTGGSSAGSTSGTGYSTSYATATTNATTATSAAAAGGGSMVLPQMRHLQQEGGQMLQEL